MAKRRAVDSSERFHQLRRLVTVLIVLTVEDTLFTCERAQGNCTITVQQIFLAGNSVLFKTLQGYLCEVNSKPHLVNRSSFYVNSLEQFKTPKQTFPIDNKFTAVAVALEFQSPTREQCLRLFLKMQVAQYCFRNISHSILIEQSQI